MSVILVLVRPTDEGRKALMLCVDEYRMTLDEIVSNTFIISPDTTGRLDEPLRRALVGQRYLMSRYTEAQATDDRLQRRIGRFGVTRGGEPSDSDRYVLIGVLGGGAHVTDMVAFARQQGVEVEELGHSVFIAFPRRVQAANFSARLKALMESLPGDWASLRIWNFETNGLSLFGGVA